MIASDAILFGEYPNPRTYGCFPIVLAEFVRAERHLRLPEAIRKMTSFPAQRLGIPDRGILRDGFRADIVVFNPDIVKTHATPRRPEALSRRHRLRHRQRPGSHRPGREHRRPPRPFHPPRPRLNMRFVLSPCCNPGTPSRHPRVGGDQTPVVFPRSIVLAV